MEVRRFHLRNQMKRYYFDTDMRGDPKPVECAEGGLVYFEEANARIAELAAEVARYKDDADTYREALNDIAGWGQTSFGVGPLVEQMRNRARSAISSARNALKDGSDG